MTPTTARVLRFHEEPCRFVDDGAVHAAVASDPGALLDHMDTGLRNLATGRWSLELPRKQVFADPDDHSDFRVMPCVVRGPGHVRKTVKVVGTNGPRQVVPDQLTVGRGLALHPDENFVTAIIDACALSSARTGAVAALAGRRLAPEGGRLSIHGCGRVGYYAARCFAADGAVESIALHDPDSDQAAALAAALAEVPGIPEAMVAPTDNPADVTVLATDSESPLDAISACAGVVISMGADTLWQRELPSSLARRTPVCVDTRDSLYTGDIAAWHAAGTIDDSDLVDLVDLLRPEFEGARPTVFVSTGSALFDNLAIDWLLGRAPARGATDSDG